ncbi:MAG TPA: sulfatase [Polyangiaceae bacterium]|jgi:arylsulfatase A-like enzyme|nr:MAG: Choline-sulfatase [Deltaproteobacteria bacterium ADurb.Bin207]HNS96999.1 sulfatase [Polyangiaceae bacterium]HNZ21966.1 sulfatase [Polyangiaceae bacterium]HOD23150.1 sulfatase [Polyangiaceae bacterium]HOE50343.1 sulfatase [Polyangiaceae bacterium]
MYRPIIRFVSTAAVMVMMGCDQRGPAAPSSEPTGNTTMPAPTEQATQETITEHAKPAPPIAEDSKQAATSTPAGRRPLNVILLVIDAMRDDMPWNGYDRPIAPNLTALHAKSVSYERGYAISSFTSKSVAGLLSGQYPSSLDRTTPFFTSYRDKTNTFMAEVLRDNGVRTLGIQAHLYLKEKSGLHQGFDDWRIVPGIEWDPNKDPFITSPQHTASVMEQLSDPKNVQGKFFAYYHYMDPHDIYNSHEQAPKWGTTPRDRYDEEIWFADYHIQKALEFVGSQPWGKDTAIIVTADHGEAFGEHGFYRHARHLYEVLIRVPLFVHIPGVEPRKIARWRSHIDIVPTVYDMMGVPIPEGLPGTSLLPEILGEEVPQRPIVADLPADNINSRRRALIDDGYKLVAHGQDVRFEMYDVRNDPAETTNLFRKDKARAHAIREQYRKVSEAIPFKKARGGPAVKKD